MVEKIYFNADIVTVDDNNPSAQAVYIKDGIIVAVGSEEEILKYKSDATTVINLCGKTLIPGFIDPHGHVGMYGLVTKKFPQLSPPPIGNVMNFDNLIVEMKKNLPKYKRDNGIFVGWGYDDSIIDEKAHPTREILDKISTEVPVACVHASGHIGVLNSKALEVIGYDENTPNPAGGVIRRYPDSNKPNGILEESAIMNILFETFNVTPKEAIKYHLAGVDDYLKAGYTTIQEGATSPQILQLCKDIADAGLYKLDVVAYPLNDFEITEGIDSEKVKYNNNFRIGGAKYLLDGSPQGRTAWMSKPYNMPPKDADANYVAYPIHTDEEVYEYFKTCVENNLQVLVHCNGDQASEQMITQYKKVLKDTGCTKDLRPVMIHAQTVRKDQLERMAKIGIIPSIYTSHINYWGDCHVQSFGEERGSNVSPMGWALEYGIKPTIHQDPPFLPPNMLHAMWAAVNRVTRSGRVIAKDQRITALEALKAATIYGARQYFEENEKGSIEVGKRADFVILNKNPLKVDPMDINDISVLQTIKDGITVSRK